MKAGNGSSRRLSSAWLANAYRHGATLSAMHLHITATEARKAPADDIQDLLAEGDRCTELHRMHFAWLAEQTKSKENKAADVRAKLESKKNAGGSRASVS
eukprot:scaffold3321_cov220-Pinguiococcus_pyrenoidosus.AAC.1